MSYLASLLFYFIHHKDVSPGINSADGKGNDRKEKEKSDEMNSIIKWKLGNSILLYILWTQINKHNVRIQARVIYNVYFILRTFMSFFAIMLFY